MAWTPTFDPTTGKVIYSNDISNPTAQLQAAADYAESVGPRSVPLYTDLEAVPFKRPGMIRVVSAEDSAYIYIDTDTGWVWLRQDSGWFLAGTNGTTFGSGYSNLVDGTWTGLWLRLLNGVMHMQGAIGRSSAMGAADGMLALPTKYRTGKRLQGVGCQVSADGSVTNPQPPGLSALAISAAWPVG